MHFYWQKKHGQIYQLVYFNKHESFVWQKLDAFKQISVITDTEPKTTEQRIIFKVLHIFVGFV